MKNLKIAHKFAVAFAISILSAIAVGIIGILNTTMLEARYSELYEMQMEPTSRILRALDALQVIRIQTRELVLNVGDTDKQSSVIESLNEGMVTLEEHMTAYEYSVTNLEAANAVAEVKTQYFSVYKPGVSRLSQAAIEGKSREELMAMIEQLTGAINSIVDNVYLCVDLELHDASVSVTETKGFVVRRFAVILAVLAGAVVVAVLLGIYLTALIRKPLILLSSFMSNAGDTGDISLRPEDVENIGKCSMVRDEIGECIGSCARFVGRLHEINRAMEIVAGGDLTSDINLLSERDVMGNSLHKMISSLNSMFGEVNAATIQVTAGTKQVSDGSQLLAQGSSEQASAVEELSSSIAEIANKTRENTEMTARASGVAATIRQNAEKGSQQMDQMLEAVKEIQEASNSIKKVIKVIDDIAFQTNILALNAAVEAARAGQHGKGFAVVAEEVRNLAAKSAAAAKDTGSLIANAMEKSALGARIAGETAVSLADIVMGINESGRITDDIASSSEGQLAAIEQINVGIAQVAHVVQQNSATAQDSASASEEMSEQAGRLEELVGQFKIKQTVINGGLAGKTGKTGKNTPAFPPAGTGSNFK